MTANLLTLTREKRAFSMQRLLSSTTTLPTLKKVAFTVICCTVLMAFVASAQTIQSIKVDPGNNNAPPEGPILDLGGAYATPPTVAVAIPGNGNETYLQYMVSFAANASTSTCTNGACSTVITFAFRDDPAQVSFTNASVTDITTPSTPGSNLLTNGNFGTDDLTGWTYVDNFGVSGAGFVSNYSGYCYTIGTSPVNCWIDGAVQAYDALSQTIPTTAGHTYQISFYVAEDSGLVAPPGASGLPQGYLGSACYFALNPVAGTPPSTCYFSDLSNNGDNADAGGNGINVAAYALPTVPVASQEETLTVTGAGAGSGTVVDTTYSEIDCTITAGSTTTGCAASYPLNTVVTLTATPADDGVSTFGGWGGGACAASGTSATCSVTMSMAQSVTAIFNQTGSPIQAGATSPGTPLDLNYDGGFTGGTGYDANVQLITGSTQTVQVNAIAQEQTTCTQLVQASFPGAQCFGYNNITGTDPYGAVMFEYTCPGSATGGTCGSATNIDFVATLGTDLYFDQADNPTLFSSSTPYTVIPLPLVGWLKGVGSNPLHPCMPNENNSPALFQSNQISSFIDPAKSPASGSAKGSSGGTGSCWVLTYLTPNEAPTVGITQPVNGFTYQQNQTTAAKYACTTVFNGVSTPTTASPTAGATGPYLTGTCNATDTPGGSVAQGAQFDTITLGPHTFTATVVDSALNTVSQTVTYNVVAATNVAILNVGPQTSTLGSRITYLIDAWDSGPANAVNTMVTDTLAPGTTFVSASGINIGFPCTIVGGKISCKVTETAITCSSSSSIVTCPVGTLMPVSLFDLNGAFITVTVQVNETGPSKTNPDVLNNTATVTQSNAETKQDNTATATTKVP
jgi:uncharacterized repeat protein (TIGR01451 family)